MERVPPWQLHVPWARQGILRSLFLRHFPLDVDWSLQVIDDLGVLGFEDWESPWCHHASLFDLNHWSKVGSYQMLVVLFCSGLMLADGAMMLILDQQICDLSWASVRRPMILDDNYWWSTWYCILVSILYTDMIWYIVFNSSFLGIHLPKEPSYLIFKSIVDHLPPRDIVCDFQALCLSAFGFSQDDLVHRWGFGSRTPSRWNYSRTPCVESQEVPTHKAYDWLKHHEMTCCCCCCCCHCTTFFFFKGRPLLVGCSWGIWWVDPWAAGNMAAGPGEKHLGKGIWDQAHQASSSYISVSSHILLYPSHGKIDGEAWFEMCKAWAQMGLYGIHTFVELLWTSLFVPWKNCLPDLTANMDELGAVASWTHNLRLQEGFRDRTRVLCEWRFIYSANPNPSKSDI